MNQEQTILKILENTQLTSETMGKLLVKVDNLEKTNEKLFEKDEKQEEKIIKLTTILNEVRIDSKHIQEKLPAIDKDLQKLREDLNGVGNKISNDDGKDEQKGKTWTTMLAIAAIVVSMSDFVIDIFKTIKE